MIIKGREIIYKDAFLQRLIEIQEYIGRYDAVKGRLFVNQFLNFAIDTIAEFPFGFVKFSNSKYPDSDLRRAVFKNDYLIIYRVSDLKIEFVEVFHTSQNPENQELK